MKVKRFLLVEFWKNLPISRKLFFLVGLMVVLISGELVVLRVSMHQMTAIRAFVGGEGLWSNAQKNAAFRFQRYALTQNESDYEKCLEHLKIYESARVARTEMLSSKMDFKKVFDGFRQVGIHADDILPIVRLVRRFKGSLKINQALQIWSEGDVKLDEFRQAVNEYHQLLLAKENSQVRQNEILDRVSDLNHELTNLEIEFSQVLGEGSRMFESLSFTFLLIIVIFVEGIGITLIISTSRSISLGLKKLNDAAVEIGKGKFDQNLSVNSKDEVGVLTQSVIQMGKLLETSQKNLESRVIERTKELSEIVKHNAELYEQANTAVQMRDEFMSVASHELKTPLTSLNLQVELLPTILKTFPETTERQRLFDRVGIIQRQTKRLVELVDELMDITRLRLGRLELKKERVDLSELISDAIGQLQVQGRDDGLQIRFVDRASAIGSFDSMRILQVVNNLLTNAVKYGENRPIDVSLMVEDHWATLMVKDEGVGIPSIFQNRIFERFERVSKNKSIGGLGLGLYISKQIVEAHGGTIAVQSEPGKGSLFIVKLALV